MTVENKDVVQGIYTVVTWITIEKSGGVIQVEKDRIPDRKSLHDAELTAVEYILCGWCDWAEIHADGFDEVIVVEFD